VRVRAACLLLVSSLAGAVEPAAPEVADCLGPDYQRVLIASADAAPADARAVWLDGRRLRWPGKPASAGYRIYFAANGGMAAHIGQQVAGAEVTIEPGLAQAAPSSASDVSFRYLGAGVELVLDAAQAARMPEMLRGQLLLGQIDAQDRLLDVTRIQSAAALDDLYADAADPLDSGARVFSDRVEFSLWAPTANNVALCLYPSPDADTATLLSLQRDAASGAWTSRLAGKHANAYYTYLVDVFVAGLGLVRNRVTDPHSLSLSANSRRSWIGSLDAADVTPDGWNEEHGPVPAAAATDMQVYELHVRDFSASDTSVPAAHRGRYLAFTDADSRGMRHLRQLAKAGTTDVHLLPVFDIATIPESDCLVPAPGGAADSESQQALIAATHERDCYNWGYEPLHYSAPEGSYASDAGDGRVRVREFRRMVQSLHEAGLRVGMDVVYNHTSASGQDAKSVLDRIVPGYYHRLDPSGTLERSTCCANTATEHRMMAKLMRDSVANWAREYHLDSFRFDLMGHQPRAAMEAVQKAVDAARGHHVVLLGEGWNFGEVADGARFEQASQLSLNGSGIATFSDRARDAVRGGGCCDSGIELFARQGYVNGLHYAPNAQAGRRATRAELLHAADLVRVGLAGTLRDFSMQVAGGETLPLSRIDYVGQAAGYASAPGEVVNYVENHDNLTLFDLNVLKLPLATSMTDRARVQILAVAINAFSQGIAYWHAGIEGLRSKSLDRNSFDSGDWFNRIDWSFRDNGFGSGLPPAADNGKDWPLLKPLLADAALKPDPDTIRWTRDAFLDLLRIRASSSLFRLRTAEEVSKRLRFLNTGPDQIATLIAEHLDGRDLAAAKFRELMLFINVDTRGADFGADAEIGKPWALHPLQRGVDAADARVRDEAAFIPKLGRFHIPARSAAVFVIE
jgi:pullulanase